MNRAVHQRARGVEHRRCSKPVAQGASPGLRVRRNIGAPEGRHASAWNTALEHRRCSKPVAQGASLGHGRPHIGHRRVHRSPGGATRFDIEHAFDMKASAAPSGAHKRWKWMKGIPAAYPGLTPWATNARGSAARDDTPYRPVRGSVMNKETRGMPARIPRAYALGYQRPRLRRSNEKKAMEEMPARIPRADALGYQRPRLRRSNEKKAMEEMPARIPRADALGYQRPRLCRSNIAGLRPGYQRPRLRRSDEKKAMEEMPAAYPGLTPWATNARGSAARDDTPCRPVRGSAMNEGSTLGPPWNPPPPTPPPLPLSPTRSIPRRAAGRMPSPGFKGGAAS